MVILLEIELMMISQWNSYINFLSAESIENSTFTSIKNFFRFALVLCTFVGTGTGDKETEDKGIIDQGKLQLFSLFSLLIFLGFKTLMSVLD